MKTIKRSTLRELTRLVRERAKHPEWSGRLWKEAVSVSMMLSRQAKRRVDEVRASAKAKQRKDAEADALIKLGYQKRKENYRRGGLL